MENKQTAVEWLVEELNKSTSLTSFVPECDEDYKQEILGIINQAIAMEKEQIKDAYENGLYDGDGRNRSHYNMNAEQYYNETFKSE